MKIKTKDDRRRRIQVRQRKRIAGSKDRPRLSVFRSVTHIYAQVIDDMSGQTLVSASSIDTGLKGAFALPLRVDLCPVSPVPNAQSGQVRSPQSGRLKQDRPDHRHTEDIGLELHQ